MLYETHLARVGAYARRRASADDAKEVVAETFLIAWRRLDEVPNDELPWLLGVARGVLSNQRRAAARRAALGDKLRREAGALQSPDHSELVEADDALRAAFAGLNSTDREVLTLVAWERLDHRRAARVIGCSPATFAVRLHRARKRLAALLQNNNASPAAPESPHPAFKEAR